MRNPSSSSSSPSPFSSSSPPLKRGPTPCCSKEGLKRGPWTAEEDATLASFVQKEGAGRWRTLPQRAGLLRCGKSCRLRWMNYLRPSVKRGDITPAEEDLIVRLHCLLGNRWSLIAGRIPGRTDNEIKNYWNTRLSKKLISQGVDPRTHQPLNHAAAKHNTSAPQPLLTPATNPNPISIPAKSANLAVEEGGGVFGDGIESCFLDGIDLDLDEMWRSYDGDFMRIEEKSNEEIGCCSDEILGFFDSPRNDVALELQDQLIEENGRNVQA